MGPAPPLSRRETGPRASRPLAEITARTAGFTLIEVLVALVVLMIGVYAMLRIFPPGFTAIEVSQQRTTAAQLAEAELTRWKLHPESLPDAIVATDYQGKLIPATLTNSAESLRHLLVYGELAARMPGTTGYRYLALPSGRVSIGNLDYYARALIYSPLDLTPSQFDAALGYPTPGGATLHPTWQPNSLYLPRTIVGEQIDLRRLGRTTLGVPFYLLSHAPLDVLRYEGEDNPGTPQDERSKVYVDIYDARPWHYVPERTGLGARQFSVDASEGALYLLPSGEDRELKVDYTDPTTLQRVLGTTVAVPAGAELVSGVLPIGVDPNGVQVHERLRALSDGEYRNYLADPLNWPRSTYYVDYQTTISGRIQFSPALQLDPRPTTDITRVKIDYRVFDWQILVFDVEVPPQGIVQLPVTHIKGPAFTNAPRQPRPQEVARGIKREYDWEGQDTGRPPTDPNTWAFVVAVDRQSGDILVDHEGERWPPNPYQRRSRFLVNYQEGLLDFNYEEWEAYGFNPEVETPDRSGRTYRIFCRAESDWAVQLMLAARQYGRSATGLPGGRPLGPEGGAIPTLLTYAWRPDIDPREIYFPLTEAGQAVIIDYYYTPPGTGELTFVEGEVHTIGPPNVTDLGQWVCRLSEPLQQEPSQWGPISVRGIGVRARAIWVSPGRAFLLQDLVSALERDPPARARPSLRETWHQVIVDSYLTRAPI